MCANLKNNTLYSIVFEMRRDVFEDCSVMVPCLLKVYTRVSMLKYFGGFLLEGKWEDSLCTQIFLGNFWSYLSSLM